jgi:anti-sigma factor RsiW
LNAFLDEELSGREQGMVEQHLSRCASCRAALEDLRKLAPLLTAFQAPPVPPVLTARIQAAAQARKKQGIFSPFSRWWREVLVLQPWALKGATTAALVIGLTMGGYMGWSSFQFDRLARSGATIYETEAVDGPLYAFQSLGVAPQGSMVAATLALAELDMRGER